MTCENCSGYGQYLSPCPTCFASDEVGLKCLSEQADDDLIDVCKASDINTVIHTMRPLDFFLWAHDAGYKIEIDDYCEIALKNGKGKPEYFGWLQHKDSFAEFDRSGVAEIARWM